MVARYVSLPLAVLLVFVAMKVYGLEANIVALSGIAIAIGTMVDMGVILVENILSFLSALLGPGHLAASLSGKYF